MTASIECVYREVIGEDTTATTYYKKTYVNSSDTSFFTFGCGSISGDLTYHYVGLYYDDMMLANEVKTQPRLTTDYYSIPLFSTISDVAEYQIYFKGDTT